MPRRFQVLARLACLAALGLCSATRADEETGTIRGQVVDEAGQPVSNIKLKLHEWRGEYEPLPRLARSDDSGQFEFLEVRSGYPLILVQDDRFGTACQSCSLEQAETKEINFQVGAPVHGQFLICDPEGNPLPGARMREFGMKSSVNGATYFRGLSFRQIGFPRPTSDAAGRMHLPPLSAGTLISVTVEHDDWAAARTEDVEVRAGPCGTIQLQPGVPVEFRVSASPELRKDLEGMVLAVDLRSEPFEVESSVLEVPRQVHQQKFHVCMQPGAYRSLRFISDEVVVTPQFMRRDAFHVEPHEQNRFSLLVRPAIPVRGVLVDAEAAAPIADQQFLVETQNLAPDGSLVLDATEPWAFLGWSQTDDNGEFVVKLPPGRGRVSLRGKGYVTEQSHYEIDVAPDRANSVPQIVARKPPVIVGRVVDDGGRPLAGVVVRIASRLLRNQQPVRSDDSGHFRIELPSIPVDFMTGERVMKHSLIAFMPHDDRCGLAQIDLESGGHPAEVVMNLAEHPPGWIFEAISSEMTDWERGEPSDESLSKMNPEMQRGKRPPVLDCREWLSVENGEQSLEAFHGKYVLLDFWTTWCGPCLADAPSLEMVHELYGDRVTVIGVHDNSVPIEEIRKFITDHEVPYPIAIDHEDGRTLKAYENVGITGYPSYILLDTEGRIVACDRTIPAPTLRSFKVEWVRQVLLENTEQ